MKTKTIVLLLILANSATPQNWRKVELTVYNMRGETIRTLNRQFQTAGSKAIVWDGKDQNRARVSSGVYVYSLRVGNDVAGKKMLVVR